MFSCNCIGGQGAQLCDEAELSDGGAAAAAARTQPLGAARADPVHEMLKEDWLHPALFSLLSVRGLTSLFITVTMAIERPFGVAVAPSVRADGAIFRP